jgi:DNA-binding transcriptional MerR regulator
MDTDLPAIPAKRYFTIGEVSDLCGVKAHVLRYWEQEFTQLRPVKRRGNRRYYQHHEVLLIRRIRQLLYAEGFTISGARNRLADVLLASRDAPAGDGPRMDVAMLEGAVAESEPALGEVRVSADAAALRVTTTASLAAPARGSGLTDLRGELLAIRSLLEA